MKLYKKHFCAKKILIDKKVKKTHQIKSRLIHDTLEGYIYIQADRNWFQPSVESKRLWDEDSLLFSISLFESMFYTYLLYLRVNCIIYRYMLVYI